MAGLKKRDNFAVPGTCHFVPFMRVNGSNGTFFILSRFPPATPCVS